MAIERITLVLDSVEAAALRNAARADLRRPRDQVRYILRLALLGAEESPPTKSTNSNRVGCDLAVTDAIAR